MAFAVPFVSNIAGVSFKNDDGTSRQEYVKLLYTGERLYLKDASSENYPEAIGVYNFSDDQLGYLPKENAQLIRSQKVDFTSLWCVVGFQGRSPRSGNYGAKIAVAKTESEAKALAEKIESGDVPFYYTRNTSEYSQPSETYLAMRAAEDRAQKLKMPVSDPYIENYRRERKRTIRNKSALCLFAIIILGPILFLVFKTINVFSFLWH